MKCREANTNRWCKVSLAADGKPLQEYHVTKEDDDTISCWSPITTGQDISVGYTISGTMSGCTLDLLIDGVLRDLYRAPQKKEARLKHKTSKFEHGLWAVGSTAQSYTLNTAELSETQFSDSEEVSKIGCLEVVVWLAPKPDVEMTRPIRPNFSDGNLGDASDQKLKGNQVIKQTHWIKRDTASENPLNWLGFRRNRKKAEEPRPGSRPWITFRFYYRTLDAIIAKGFKIGPTDDFTVKPVISDVQDPEAGASHSAKDDTDSIVPETKTKSPLEFSAPVAHMFDEPIVQADSPHERSASPQEEDREKSMPTLIELNETAQETGPDTLMHNLNNKGDDTSHPTAYASPKPLPEQDPAATTITTPPFLTPSPPPRRLMSLENILIQPPSNSVDLPALESVVCENGAVRNLDLSLEPALPQTGPSFNTSIFQPKTPTKPSLGRGNTPDFIQGFTLNDTRTKSFSEMPSPDNQKSAQPSQDHFDPIIRHGLNRSLLKRNAQDEFQEGVTSAKKIATEENRANNNARDLTKLILERSKALEKARAERVEKQKQAAQVPQNYLEVLLKKLSDLDHLLEDEENLTREVDEEIKLQEELFRNISH